jgi:hypothetical protein
MEAVGSPDCRPTYVLYVYKESTSQYVPVIEFLDYMHNHFLNQNSPVPMLYIHLDAFTADFHYSISNYDMDILAPLITDTQGETMLKLQVAAIIPGSTTQGQGAQLGALQKHEFVLRLVDSATVEACAMNVPTLSGNRSVIDFDHQLQTTAELNGGNPSFLVVDATPVTPSVQGCEIVTKLYFKEYPFRMNADGTTSGKWAEISTSAAFNIAVTPNMLEWGVSQDMYREELIRKFGFIPEDSPNFIPRTVFIEAKFVTTDAINSDSRVEDAFYLIIHSNGEGWSAACDFNGLSLRSPTQADLGYNLIYDVQEANPLARMANPLREFPLSTIVDGIDATLTACEIHVVLAVNIAAPNAQAEWKTLYNERAE